MLKFSVEEKSNLSAAIFADAFVKAIGEIKAEDDGSNSFEVIMTSGALDRHGETVNPDGWVFDNYMLNPVVLYAHDYSSLPIGLVNEIRRDGDKWIAKGVFAPEDASPMAGYVKKLYKAGFIKTVSVGFMPLELDANYNSIRQELLELSFVPVPANPEALSLAKKLGLDIDELKAKGILKEGEPEATDDEPKVEPAADEPKDEPAVDLEVEVVKIMADATDKVRALIVANAQKSVGTIVEKAGRVISEKNRTLIKDCADGLRSSMHSMEKSITALEELHNATESSTGEPDGQEPDGKSANREMVVVQRLVRIADKSIEDALRIIASNVKR